MSDKEKVVARKDESPFGQQPFFHDIGKFCFPISQKGSAGCALARISSMSQATALGARVPQAELIVLLLEDAFNRIKCNAEDKAN